MYELTAPASVVNKSFLWLWTMTITIINDNDNYYVIPDILYYLIVMLILEETVIKSHGWNTNRTSESSSISTATATRHSVTSGTRILVRQPGLWSTMRSIAFRCPYSSTHTRSSNHTGSHMRTHAHIHIRNIACVYTQSNLYLYTYISIRICR